MKKSLFVAIAIFFTATVAVAQPSLDKGNFFVGANLSDVYLSFGDGTSFILNGAGGYFVQDNLAVLAQLGMGFADNYSLFGLAAGARYYFAAQEKGSFFGGAMFGFQKQKDIDAEFGLNLHAGYSFFLNSHVALEPMAQLDIPFQSGGKITFVLGGGISVYF